jgi:hypothetical protein
MSCPRIATKSRFAFPLRALGLGFLCLSSVAHAAPAPLTIVNNSPLSFGSFVIINNGQVTVSPSGGMANYTNAFAVTGGTPAPATFTITGEPNSDIAIAIPSGTLTENISGITATFSNFNATTSAAGPPPASPFFNVTLPSTGTMTMTIGGDVAISRSSGSGTVSVNIPVTASYIPKSNASSK